MGNKNIKIQDMIDFVTGSDSELSELSEEEEEIEDDDMKNSMLVLTIIFFYNV